MHKERAKEVMRAAGVPVPEGEIVARGRGGAARTCSPRPYVLKPVAEGSSVGVFIVREDHAHPPQELNDPGWAFGEDLLAERYIPGRELTCAVHGRSRRWASSRSCRPRRCASTTMKPNTRDGGSRHLLPAPISSNVYELVQKLTLTAHRALGCRGVSRADFRYDDTPGGTGELICLEVNTQPGMTRDFPGSGAGGARRA